MSRRVLLFSLLAACTSPRATEPTPTTSAGSSSAPVRQPHEAAETTTTTTPPAAALTSEPIQIVVAVDPAGGLVLGDHPIDEAALAAYARGLVDERGAAAVSVIIDPDRSTTYARVVHVMDLLLGAGVTEVSLADHAGDP